jgi:hypothetical protein
MTRQKPEAAPEASQASEERLAAQSGLRSGLARHKAPPGRGNEPSCADRGG